MKTMKIYEPAMCCSTGCCGASIDPTLLRVAGTIETLRKEAGIIVERYNLTSAPDAFAANPVVAEYLNAHGIEALPIVLVDGAIYIAGRYPTNCEFSSVFEFPRAKLSGYDPAKHDKPVCCCSKC